MGKHGFSFLVITLLSLVGLKALFQPGLFSAHDIWHQVARFYHYQRAFLDGQIPPYWIGTLAHGLGYPLFFFSYPLPWISGLALLWAGIPLPGALKILFFASFLFSGIFMYIFAKTFFKDRWAALLVASLYLWAPFRFQTILVSAAMGTAFAFVFLPILLLGIYKAATDKNGKFSIVFCAIGLAGIILSHLMSFLSLITLISLLVVWSLSFAPKAKFSKRIIFGFVLGIALSSFYLVPAIYYSNLTQISTGTFATLYQKHFVNFSQLIYSKWGYGLVKDAKEAAISYQVGIAQWLSAAGVILWGLRRKLKSLSIFLLFGFVVSLLAMVDFSRPIWNLVTKFVTLDIPTHFLLPAMSTGSILAGLFFLSVKKSFRPIVFITLLAVALYTNRNHLRVNLYTDFPVSLYVAAETTTNSFHEYFPRGADIDLLYQRNLPFIIPETLALRDISQNTRRLSFKVVVPQKMDVTLKHLVFPGITVYVDKQKFDFKKDEKGRIKVNLDLGTHDVLVAFEETALIKLAKIITVAGILGLLLLLKR